MLRYLTTLLVLFSVARTNAQSAFISDAISIRNDYGYEIIGRLRDRILLFRDKYDEFEIQAYDNNLRLAWSKELDDLGKKGIHILTVLSGKNDFSVVYKVRRKGHTFLRLHKYDPGANLIDSMMLKDYGERVFSPPNLEFVKSEDRNCVAVYNTAERDKLEVTCFRLDKMQTLWDKSIHLEDNFDGDTDDYNMVVSNAGDFFLIRERNNRRSKLENHELNVLHVNTSSEAVSTVKLPEYVTVDAEWVYDNLHKYLVGGGLYGEKNRDHANGSFYLRLSAGINTPVSVKYEPFDDQFISILRQKDVEDDTRGIAYGGVNQILLRQDGGAVIVFERVHEIQRGSAAGRGFFRDGIRMVVDFYFDDIFAVAVLPDGSLHWRTVLHKKQYSQDDEGTFSSYFLHRNADKFRLMFNDEVKYENTCSEYVISPAGAFDRNSLMNTIGKNLRLRFKDALQITPEECLVPSEFRNKLRLVMIRY